jgi:hypothetical protein
MLSMSDSDIAITDATTRALVLLLNLGRAASVMASGLAESNFDHDSLMR